MLGRSQRELLIGLDEREHGVVVRRRVVAIDITLHASLSRRTALGELLDEFVAQKLIRRGRLYKL